MNSLKREEVKNAMGEWIGGLAPWDAFCTWTFSRPVSVSGAMYMGRRYFDWVRKVAEQPIYGFVATERGKTGGLVHLHGLLGNVKHLQIFCGEFLPAFVVGRKCCLVHSWKNGYSRVVPYDPALGAKHYVSKYVVKDLGEWELFGFPAAPQTAFGHKGAEFVPEH